MQEARNWTVEIRLAYDVMANSADQALGAVLPLVSLGPDRYGPQPKIADYTVREISGDTKSIPASTDPVHGLTKPVYTAKEAAGLLGISLNLVYSRIPSMSIGRLRRYSRAAILNVLEHGIERDVEPQRPVRVSYDRPMRREKVAKVVIAKSEKTKSPVVTIKEAAKLLRISPYKMRQLVEAKKIYYHDDYGKKYIPREAIKHFTDGRTPREFVVRRLAEVKDDPVFTTPEDFEKFAAEWLAKWPEG